MQRPRMLRLRHLLVGMVVLAACLCAGSAWARGRGRSGPGLWIVADRIVGFVPFTVYVYGKVVGAEPGDIELCRSEVAWLTDTSSARITGGGHATALDGRQGADAEDPPCAAGKVVRTPDGYDYVHDMRFQRPGTYHVRLTMVDRSGHRVVSNSVQVNAF